MLQQADLTEIHEQILSNISDEYDKTVGYLTNDLTKAFAIEEKTIIDNANLIYKSINVENLTGVELETFIEQRKGIERKQATYSTGVVTVTGIGNINIGDLFETRAGTQFQATANVVVTESAKVPVQAVIAGTNGNVPKNTITLLPVTIVGISNVINEEVTTGGYDAETDIALRERYYRALRIPATSGNKYHYLQWALEVTGVGDAKVFPLEKGANTVTVVILNDDKKPADTDLVKKVQDYIDPNNKGTGEGQAPIGAHCYIESAVALNVNIQFTLEVLTGYDKENLKSLIENGLNSYFKDIAFKQSYVSYAKIGSIIIDTEGVKDYSNLTINNGVANIDIGDKQVAQLGGVTVD